MKTVSIIVPVYNRADVIGETIQSVLNQTYTDWELLLVDDGSTDASRDVLNTLSRQDSRIKPFYRETYSKSKGAPVCRNIGLVQAKGIYVIFLDSDDILKLDSLENRVSNFETHRDCDFLVFPGAFFTKAISDSDRLWNKFTSENDLLRFLRGDVVWQTSGPIWKRSYLLGQGLEFDESAASSQDWEFHIYSLLKGPKFLKITGQPDYFVRRDDNESGRISGRHSSLVKFKNRIELIKRLIEEISSLDQLCALHKYLVRDAVFCLRRETSKEVVELFGGVNNLFPRSISIGWSIAMYFIYKCLKYKADIPFRFVSRVVNIVYPGYFKGFKMNYRAKY